jgi:dolichol-phosphate mannosyltransferase
VKVSVILPTYNESGNIGVIVPNITTTFLKGNIIGEIIVVDDDSPDGTADAARRISRTHPVRVHVRKGERGLASAVLKGFELARGDILIVMDADLSHPVDKIPEMIRPIVEGTCDATVGTRYMVGGGCENWPLARKFMSKGAGIIAKGVTGLSDPTSGFMAVRKAAIAGKTFDPIGWKIVLEVIVKANLSFREVPIYFKDRYLGESKLTLKVQRDYLRHLWKLYCFKYETLFQFIKFCAIGSSGVLIDTVVLVGLVELLFLDPRFAAVFSFLAAVSWNYVFNRLWTFKREKKGTSNIRYIMFVIVCLFGLLIRIGVMHLLIEYAGMWKGRYYVFASMAGILAATIFNFMGSKYIAFNRTLFPGTQERS